MARILANTVSTAQFLSSTVLRITILPYILRTNHEPPRHSCYAWLKQNFRPVYIRLFMVSQWVANSLPPDNTEIQTNAFN